ncbi:MULTISPECIES: sensor histidine kinase [unclassified Paenibacillus]|uniref:cache domain-containing sensor histidine kinase n=1 Tax=unclassified Paenibacillus TaxID=185978 RepID=UPI0015A099CF|nr:MULTISPECIES: sensor histidine kinase [unclassified Paenibacillus]
MLILLFIVSFLYDRKSTEIIHGKISALAEKNISQTVGLFNLLLQGYDSVTKSLNSNYELLRLLQERDANKDPSVSFINERTITNIIGASYYSRDDIVGIHIITNGGKNYSYERRFAGVMDANYFTSDWYKKLLSSSGEMVWLGLYPGSVINRFSEDPLFVFGRKLFDLTDHQEIGVMLIETDPKPILAALSNVTISPNSRVYIVDREDRMIASTEREQDRDPVKLPSFSRLPRPEADHIIVDDGGDQLIVAAKAVLSDWTVFGLTPKGDMNAEVVKTRNYLLIVGLALVLVATALASLISRSMSSPLKLLIREMKQVEMGNFRGSVNVRSFDEINSLVSSFNRMVRRMDELIERITLASISEKNAELQALQSQVNPHFLYNTLDMIYWMLDEQENDRLGRVILALSHMFRYSSDWQEASKTTLRQELEQMQHYMTIIENRLAGRVRTDIQVAPEWLGVPLPKMTLQPIIENAVKYGLEPLHEHAGVLRVYTEAEGDELRIVICDNGAGMEPQTLERLRASLQDNAERERSAAGAGALTDGAIAGGSGMTAAGAETPPPGLPSARTRRGIGLANVHRRMTLMFGEAYGLRINSTPGEGTTVILTLPLPRQGGSDNHDPDSDRR